MAPRAQRVLRWNGREDGAEPVAPVNLRTGDIVILPATLGGYDAHGWAANATDAVPDIAEAALWVATGRRLLRFDDAAIDVAEIDAVIRVGRLLEPLVGGTGFTGRALPPRCRCFAGSSPA